MPNNLEVIVQPPNKPKERRHVGFISDGHKPTPEDWSRWQIAPASVIEARIRKIGGERKYLVVAVG